MRGVRFWCIVAALSNAVACSSVDKKALSLQRDQLKLELSTLQTLQTQLQSPPFPPGSRDVEVFVSAPLINQVLTAADGFREAIPGISGGTIHVESIRFSPRDDSPFLTVKASATDGSLAVSLSVTAILFVDDATPTAPVFRVRIRDVAPEIKVSSINIFVPKFVRQLLTIKADTLAMNRLSFPLPTQSLFSVDTPALNLGQQLLTPRNNGSWVHYSISRPASSQPYNIRVDRYVFLRDGVHVYASLI
jgi:hypothetical protein